MNKLRKKILEQFTLPKVDQKEFTERDVIAIAIAAGCEYDLDIQPDGKWSIRLKREAQIFKHEGSFYVASA